MLTFGNIGKNTVIKDIDAPNRKYNVQVIDCSQGALGGSTIVNVYEKKEFNTVIFIIKKKPQCIYSGDWGESENIQIYWKNSRCIIIDSVEYPIG